MLKGVHLERLRIEWLNRGAQDFYRSDGSLASMQGYEDQLLELKSQISYEQNWMDVITRAPCTLPRHRENDAWIIRLLYLWDGRYIPISHLQTSCGLHQGRMYKTFGRAGLQIKATTAALTPKIPVDFRPWPGEIYFDPLGDAIYRRGERIHHVFEMTDIGRDFLEGDEDDRYAKDEKRVFVVPILDFDDARGEDFDSTPFPSYYPIKKQKDRPVQYVSIHESSRLTKDLRKPLALDMG